MRTCYTQQKDIERNKWWFSRLCIDH